MVWLHQGGEKVVCLLSLGLSFLKGGSSPAGFIISEHGCPNPFVGGLGAQRIDVGSPCAGPRLWFLTLTGKRPLGAIVETVHVEYPCVTPQRIGYTPPQGSLSEPIFRAISYMALSLACMACRHAASDSECRIIWKACLQARTAQLVESETLLHQELDNL